MSQTKTGAKNAAHTLKTRYGEQYFKQLGSKGGKTPTPKPKGFALDPERARLAGAKGGAKSRRTPSKKPVVNTEQPDWKTTFERTNPLSEAVKRLAAPLRNITKR